MKNFTMRQIVKVGKKNRLISLSLVVLVGLNVIFSLLPALLLRVIIDDYLLKGMVQGLAIIMFSYLFVLLIGQALEFGKNALLTYFGQKLVHELRYQMMSSLNHRNILYFSSNTAGSISSRLITDVNSVSRLFADGLISMLIDGFKIIGILISIWVFSRALGLLALIIIPILVVISRWFQKRMLKAETTNLVELAKVNEHIQETLANRHLIKATHSELMMEEKYDECLQENYQTIEKVNFYDALYSPLVQLLRALMITGLVLLVGVKSPFVSISVGMVASCIELITSLFAPIEALGTEIQNIQKGLSGVVRIDEFMQEKEEAPKDSDCLNKIREKKGYIVEFKDLSFSYDENHPVIECCNASFQAPDSITFMGRTGSGKSTLFKLILGLLEPTHGEVRINGINVLNMNHNEKRDLFGYVEQNFTFISGTVADQVSVKDSSITQEMIESAMKFVGLHETIEQMEHGYQTEIVPERDFSLGQQQLLSIARAVVKNPPILLLDEISASLDSITEEKVMNLLRKAQENRILFSISHRTAGILDQNRIFSLDTYRILES